jgi:hypothetical protein
VRTGYAWGGAEVAHDDASALAKACCDSDTGRKTYWVKFATAGPDAGHMFNPQSPTFNAAQAKRAETQMGKSRYEFRKVSERAFGFYLQFMTSPHNPTFLRHAERS